MEADFRVEALREAAARYGPPVIACTGQGSQFSSAGFVAEVARIGATDTSVALGAPRGRTPNAPASCSLEDLDRLHQALRLLLQ